MKKSKTLNSKDIQQLKTITEAIVKSRQKFDQYYEKQNDENFETLVDLMNDIQERFELYSKIIQLRKKIRLKKSIEVKESFDLTLKIIKKTDIKQYDFIERNSKQVIYIIQKLKEEL